MEFRIIDECPCPVEVAAQVYMVLRKAGQTASSIYRGQDAAALLHRYGKHTQREIHQLYPLISNPEGRSEHECRSDGIGKSGPIGRRLPDWQVGVDSGTNSAADRKAIQDAAAAFGWTVHHDYDRGVEGHHWCFVLPPRPVTPWQSARIAWLRRRLPKR